MANAPLNIGVLGIDHRHIFGQLGSMEGVGGRGTKWWTEGEPSGTTIDFQERFPDIERVSSVQEVLDDESISLVLIAAVPNQRAALAIAAMRAGKDVMVDKPGCTTMAQLDEIKQVVKETGRIWSIDFSERFEVEAVTKAAELVAAGAIGRVVQTIGMGPHRLNLPTRPGWFFDPALYGGILCDIASHQIDQFLFFTGSTDAEVIASSYGNYANPKTPGLQDFGDILLRSDKGQAYIRVDWFTPDGLPTWGDGRLTILGTEGYIELRKYVWYCAPSAVLLCQIELEFVWKSSAILTATPPPISPIKTAAGAMKMAAFTGAFRRYIRQQIRRNGWLI